MLSTPEVIYGMCHVSVQIYSIKFLRKNGLEIMVDHNFRRRLLTLGFINPKFSTSDESKFKLNKMMLPI